MRKAEVTAFLSLIFVMLVTFVGGVMEAASIQVAKNQRYCDGARAMESVFAEYQKEALEEYDVFVLDAGYESVAYSEELLDKRLQYYGVVNSQNSIERIQFLSDENGKAFFEQACAYTSHRYGLDYVKDMVGMTDLWEGIEKDMCDYEKEERENHNQLDSILEENEYELVQENNPIASVEGLKQSPVLSLVMPEGKTVSEKTVTLAELPSRRTLNQGYGDFKDSATYGRTVGKLLFGEYLLEHFNSAADECGNVLEYELEYLIAGKSSDRENLKTVVNRLLILRLAVHYIGMQKDADRQAKAQTLALTLCSALAVPAVTEVVAQGILLAWSYEDAVLDVKALLQGQKVSLTANGTKKLGYEEYLRIFLFLEKEEEITMRALDLMEMNLRNIQGLEFFKVDICVTRMEIKSRCSFRRGITYTFPLYFAYN